MWRRSQQLDLPQGQGDASCCHLQKTLQQAPGFELAPCPAPRYEGCCPKQGLHASETLQGDVHKLLMRVQTGRNRNLEFSSCWQSFLFLLIFLNPCFKSPLFLSGDQGLRCSTRGGMPPASKSPKEHHRCVRQGGKWERKDPKAQQGNFRWQEAKA